MRECVGVSPPIRGRDKRSVRKDDEDPLASSPFRRPNAQLLAGADDGVAATPTLPHPTHRCGALFPGWNVILSEAKNLNQSEVLRLTQDDRDSFLKRGEILTSSARREWACALRERWSVSPPIRGRDHGQCSEKDKRSCKCVLTYSAAVDQFVRESECARGRHLHKTGLKGSEKFGETNGSPRVREPSSVSPSIRGREQSAAQNIERSS